MTGFGIPVWIVVIAAVLAAIPLAVYLSRKFKQASEYIRLVKQSGYLPPPPNKLGLFWLDVMARFILFFNVGRVKVVGRENLEKLDGEAYIVTPNHPHFADVAVLPYVLGERRARYMAARGVMTFGGGVGALIFGPMGAFAVDLTPGKGGGARDAAIEVVSTGQILGMFPEAWAHLDGKTRRFKKGAVRIAKEAAKNIGKDTYVVPTYFRYGKNPGDWINKVPPPASYFLTMLLFPFYRRGVTVVFGEPIASSNLAADDEEATTNLRERVLELDPLKN